MHDVVIVGGGQAGLAMSSVLRRRGREHVVLERDSIGGRWRSERWDSLRFQFPNWALQLPGYSYQGGDPDGFAHYSEILGLLEDYAAGGEVQENTEVVALRQGDGSSDLLTSAGTIRARRVVVATGPFQRPFIPSFAQDVAPAVLQTDPTRYRCPEQLPGGAVLVVGSGASGYQIADELLDAGRRVYLSVSRHRRVPRRYQGKDIYWWLEALGRFAQTIDGFPGRDYPPTTLVTGVNGGYDADVRHLASNGATVIGRVLAANGSTLTLKGNANQILDAADQAYADFLAAASQLAGTPVPQAEPGPAVAETHELDLAEQGINTIVWATGYAYDFDWIKVPVFDDRGRPVQQRGVTPRPGLYFLGLHWMHTFKSGLLSGVGADAEYLADQFA